MSERAAIVTGASSGIGFQTKPLYSATTAGVIGLTQAMNKELNGEGIKSIAFAPGFVDTPMTESL